MFSKATQTMIPFFGFALGNSINLKVIGDTGLLGIFLGIAVIIITGIPLILADKFIGGGNGACRCLRDRHLHSGADCDRILLGLYEEAPAEKHQRFHRTRA